jgi:hypothetical protein
MTKYKNKINSYKNIFNSYNFSLKQTITYQKIGIDKPCLINKYDLSNKASVYTDVFVHFGPICLKKKAVFISNITIIEGKLYYMDNAIYDDNLYEIKISTGKIIRIQYSNNYNLIKNLQRTQLTKINHNNIYYSKNI